MNKFLSEIAIFKNGKKRPNVNGEIPVYGGNNILGYTNSYNYENCIIVGRVGAYCGNVYYTDKKCWVSDNAIAVLPRKDTNILYLYYLLKSLNLNTRSVGSSQPLITQEILNSIICNIPEENIQEKIAKMLYTLDLKIKCNELINDNLEKQARLIFNKIFINIDKVPKNWKYSNLLQIANYTNGLAMQKFRPIDKINSLPVLKIKELRQGYCDNNSELCSISIDKKYIVNNGDVIFSWSGTLLLDIWCSDTCGLNQHLFKITSEKYNKWFYYFWTKYHLNKFISIASSKATTMGHIKREDLLKSTVILPSENDYKKIDALINPIFSKIINIKIESYKLNSIRNKLLPNLITGKIKF